jgi:hypothetical protein
MNVYTLYEAIEIAIKYNQQHSREAIACVLLATLKKHPNIVTKEELANAELLITSDLGTTSFKSHW